MSDPRHEPDPTSLTRIQNECVDNLRSISRGSRGIYCVASRAPDRGMAFFDVLRGLEMELVISSVFACGRADRVCMVDVLVEGAGKPSDPTPYNSLTDDGTSPMSSLKLGRRR
jgi:hypothetical protein